MSAPAGRERGAAALLGAAFAALYLAFPQPWLWGDGAALAQNLDEAARDVRYGLHVAYPALGRLVRAASGLSSFRALEVVSALSAAAGLAATYLLARHLSVPRAAAGIAVALAGLSPALWFFATTIEVHASHFAAVACVALAIVALPWRRFVPSLVASTALVALLPPTHLSAPLLGPGLVACVALASRRHGRPLSAARVLLAVGPALLAGLLAGLALAESVRDVPQDVLAIGSATSIVRHYPGVPGAHWWRDELLVGQGVLLLLALAGVWLVRRRRGALAVVAAFLVPEIAFHAWWAVDNRGGYFLAATPGLAVLAGFALARAGSPWRGPRRAVAGALVLALVVGQAWLAVRTADAAHVAQDPVLRAAREVAVRAATGGRGVLVTLDPGVQPITRELPGVWELNYSVLVATAVRLGRAPEEAALRIAEGVEAAYRDRGTPVVLDVGHRELEATMPVLRPYFDALDAELGRRFAITPLGDAGWPLVRLERLAEPAPSVGAPTPVQVPAGK